VNFGPRIWYDIVVPEAEDNKKWSKELDDLRKMGFEDDEVNVTLLEKHKSVARVVEHLLE